MLKRIANIELTTKYHSFENWPNYCNLVRAGPHASVGGEPGQAGRSSHKPDD